MYLKDALKAFFKHAIINKSLLNCFFLRILKKVLPKDDSFFGVINRFLDHDYYSRHTFELPAHSLGAAYMETPPGLSTCAHFRVLFTLSNLD